MKEIKHYFFFLFIRVCQQPEADAWVWEVPGAADEDDEDAGGLRAAADRDGRQQAALTAGAHRVLRDQAAGDDRQARTGVYCASS